MFNEEARVETPDESRLVSMVNIEKARRVFFYQKKDEDGDVMAGTPIIACYEQEAGMYGKFHKLIAVGDGQAYRKSLLECGVKTGQTITAGEAKKILQAAFDAELAAAKANGKKVRPQYQAVHFDDTILRHRNARNIMDNFSPPG
jgi:hypothetical protein